MRAWTHNGRASGGRGEPGSKLKVGFHVNQKCSNIFKAVKQIDEHIFTPCPSISPCYVAPARQRHPDRWQAMKIFLCITCHGQGKMQEKNWRVRLKNPASLRHGVSSGRSAQPVHLQSSAQQRYCPPAVHARRSGAGGGPGRTDANGKRKSQPKGWLESWRPQGGLNPCSRTSSRRASAQAGEPLRMERAESPARPPRTAKERASPKAGSKVGVPKGV